MRNFEGISEICMGNKYQKIIAFFLSVACFLLLHQLKNVASYPYDAGGYWGLSDPKVFFNFPANQRGCFYPLLLLPAHFFSNLIGHLTPFIFRAYTSIVYAFVLTIIIPPFYVSIFGGKITCLRRMITPILIATLFPGLVIYPLSDLPSFLLLCSCVSLLIHVKNQKWSLISILLLIAAGFLAYGAYNTRPIYLFPMICILFLVPIFILKMNPLRIKILALLALIVGMGLAASPQILINHKNHAGFSPFVTSGKSLFALQSMWGVTIQKYSTYLSSPTSGGGLYYMDSAGMKFFESEQITGKDISIHRYLSLVAQNLMHFIGTYSRHVINGMDLRDGEVYVQDLTHSCHVLSAINFSLIFLGLWTLYVRRAKSSIKHPRLAMAPDHDFATERVEADSSWAIWFILLILPVIAIVPGAIETRFFLPIQMLLYCTIAFNASIHELIKQLSENFLPITLIFLASFSLFCAVSLNTEASLQTSIDPKYMNFTLS